MWAVGCNATTSAFASSALVLACTPIQRFLSDTILTASNVMWRRNEEEEALNWGALNTFNMYMLLAMAILSFPACVIAVCSIIRKWLGLTQEHSPVLKLYHAQPEPLFPTRYAICWSEDTTTRYIASLHKITTRVARVSDADSEKPFKLGRVQRAFRRAGQPKRCGTHEAIRRLKAHGLIVCSVRGFRNILRVNSSILQDAHVIVQDIAQDIDVPSQLRQESGLPFHVCRD